MTRIFLIFGAILGIAALSAWFADNPGDVVIEFGQYQIDTSLAALVLLSSLLMAGTGAAVWIAGWARRELPVVGSNRVYKRQGRGIQLLNKSLVALSAGDHKLAGRLIGQAEVLLPPQPMVHLIAAEAATRGGNHEEATKRYRALEKTDEGRLLGLRGLLTEARRKGTESEALKLARVAFRENRKSPWVIKTLFALEVAAANWTEAEAALKTALKENLVSKARGQSHKAAIHYAEAMEMSAAGKRTDAKKMLAKALSEKSGFAAAVTSLARLELTDGNGRKAAKLLRDAWKGEPHPMYIPVYKEIDTTESREDWLKRARKLVDQNPDHGESRLLLVDAMMDARHYDTVKPILEDLLKSNPGRRAFQFRLALAHATGEDADAFETALDTARDRASWQCGECGDRPTGWSVLCPSCQSFDSIDWVSADKLKDHHRGFDPGETIAILSDEDERPKAIPAGM